MVITLGVMKPESQGAEARRYFKEVRFRQIRALVETARHGSFAQAARQLGLSTPSVWRQVRALEEDYGVQLVEARGHEVSLTDDGERLVDLAAPLVEGFDSLKRVFAEQHGRADLHLRVTAPVTVLNSSLREVIVSYRRSHPTVRFSLIDSPSRVAWQLLEAEKADLAIVGTPEGVTLPGRFEVHPLVRYPFEAVCAVGHPFGRIKRPTLRDLLAQALILAGEDSSSRMQFDHRVAKAGLQDRVNIVMTAGNISSILSYVALGIGVAVLTRPATEALPLPAGAEGGFLHRDLSECLGHDQIVLLHPKRLYEPAHLRAFREMVLEGLKEKS